MKFPKLVGAAQKGRGLFSKQFYRELKEKDRLWVLPLAGLGILAALISFSVMLFQQFNTLFSLSRMVELPELPYIYLSLGTWAFGFLSSIPLVFSLLYYSKDLPLLFSLPVTKGDVVLSKLAIIYSYILAISLFLHGTMAAVIIHQEAESVLLLSFLGISSLVMPLFSIAVAVFFVALFLRLFNVVKYRVLFEVLGMFLAMGLLVALNMAFSRSMMDQQSVNNSMKEASRLLSYLINAFPPAAWISRALAFQRFGDFLLYLGFSGISFFLAWFFSKSTLDRILENQSAKKSESSSGEYRPLKSRGLLQALIKKDLSILFSNSTFIFQGVGEMLILPILLAIYVFAIPKEYLNDILTAINSVSAWMPLIILGVTTMFTGLSSFGCTTISREGKSLQLPLCLPLSGLTHFHAKMILHLRIYSIIFILDSLVLSLIFQMNLVSWLLILLPGLLLVFISFVIGLWIDLSRPVLNWTHPMEAVKNNLNVVINMGLLLAYLAVLGVLVFFLTALLHLPQNIVLLILFGILIIPARLLYVKVKTRAIEFYSTGYPF